MSTRLSADFGEYFTLTCNPKENHDVYVCTQLQIDFGEYFTLTYNPKEIMMNMHVHIYTLLLNYRTTATFSLWHLSLCLIVLLRGHRSSCRLETLWYYSSIIGHSHKIRDSL